MKRFTLLLMSILLIAACSPALKSVTMPSQTAFYVFRTDLPALLELSPANQILRETPVAIPEGCTLDNLFAPPMGQTLAIEYSCSFGQAVVMLNTANAATTQPVTDSDSHFMAWTPDGEAAYLKVDTMNRPRIVLARLGARPQNVPITELSYDVSPRPGTSADFLFSFSRGMGLGSEMWLAQDGGLVVQRVAADPHHYLSFARWSPDGSQLAFIKIPDTATPFTVGELWVMQADGSRSRKLADADAGHGFAEAWSPDGSQIAFVVRDNPSDARADQDAGALQSNIALVNVHDGTQRPLTLLKGTRVEAPAWSPDGNNIAFTAVLNDKMNVYLADVNSGPVQKILPVSACCPVWMRR